MEGQTLSQQCYRQSFVNGAKSIHVIHYTIMSSLSCSEDVHTPLGGNPPFSLSRYFSLFNESGVLFVQLRLIFRTTFLLKY